MRTRGADETQEIMVESWADDRPASNNFRYFLMRLTRLIGCLVSEVLMFACAPVLAVSLFACFGYVLITMTGGVWAHQAHSNYKFVTLMLMHPFISSGLSVMLGVKCFGLSLSFGLPYRFKWRMPGSSTVVCDSCHGETADEFVCGHCKSTRILVRLATCLVQVANYILYVLWIVHDVTIGVFAIMLRG
jgi:hypothetical protein